MRERWVRMVSMSVCQAFACGAACSFVGGCGGLAATPGTTSDGDGNAAGRAGAGVGAGASSGSGGTSAGGGALGGGVSGSSGDEGTGSASGSSGLGGSDGGADSGGGGEGPTGGCVDVSHVDARQEDDLRMIGSGFDAYEGHTIRVLVTHGAPTYGLGEAPIEAGAFDILLPGVLGDYTGIAVHVDRVRDNACNPDDEFIWQMTTGPGPGDTVWEVTPDTLRVFEEVGPCSLNGIFDLTPPLPCPTEPEVGAENPYAPCPMDEPFDNTCPIEDSTCSSLRGCEPPCDTTDACPTPQSGSAAPYCNFGICVLECDSEHGCPDGMLCSTGWCNYERP